jgi:hypothetical protein
LNTLVNFQSAQPSKTGQFSFGINKRVQDDEEQQQDQVHRGRQEVSMCAG